MRLADHLSGKSGKIKNISVDVITVTLTLSATSNILVVLTTTILLQLLCSIVVVFLFVTTWSPSVYMMSMQSSPTLYCLDVVSHVYGVDIDWSVIFAVFI